VKGTRAAVIGSEAGWLVPVLRHWFRSGKAMQIDALFPPWYRGRRAPTWPCNSIGRDRAI